MAAEAEQATWLSWNPHWRLQVIRSQLDKVELADRTSRPEVLGHNQDFQRQELIFVHLEEVEEQQTALLLAETEGAAAAVQRGQRVGVELRGLALQLV